jgi:predicted dienelactone hydrolase
MYDPFSRGRFPVGVRTIEANDKLRNRMFPIEIWYPAASQHAGQEMRDAAANPGEYPLILFSHHSRGHRRSATFLCTHLASHGYVVAALDHSEVVAAELRHKDGETAEDRAAIIEAAIASRVPDIRFLLDRVLESAWDPSASCEATHIAIVGHSFGGWTALAAPEV